MSFEGSDSGKFSGRCSELELETLCQLLIGSRADQRAQQIARLLELALQRRQQLLCLRERRLLRRNVELRDVAEVQLLAQDVERALVAGR